MKSTEGWTTSRNTAAHINNDAAILPLKARAREVCKDLLGIPTQPCRFRLHAIDLCVLLGSGYRLGIHLDSSYAVKSVTEANAEKARTAICVNEMCRPFSFDREVGRENCLSDVLSERGKDGIVVLEEAAGGEGEHLVSDSFKDGLSVVRDGNVILRGENRGIGVEWR